VKKAKKAKKAQPPIPPGGRGTLAKSGGTCHFDMAVLKGLVEHNDVGSYFGSFGGLGAYCADAAYFGWITMDLRPDGTHDVWSAKVTDAGRHAYETLKLADLPQMKLSRAYLWEWPVYCPGTLRAVRPEPASEEKGAPT
jgi:hypothetical protein